jgi:hypothetical protein
MMIQASKPRLSGPFLHCTTIFVEIDDHICYKQVTLITVNEMRVPGFPSLKFF